MIGFAGTSLFDNPVAKTPINSSSLISGKLILITFPLKISFAETIFSINSIDFFVINSISFASYDATEIAIGGYFKFLPPTAAPTAVSYTHLTLPTNREV